MNRIDRLTSILLLLQSHRVITAEKIAEHFEISIRTVYRDIAALSETGVPIVAEAGVGYSLMKGYSMPPIMFTESEAAALFMSGEVTDQFSDDSLKQNLKSALLKVKAALPEGHKNHLNRLGSKMEVWSRPNDMEDSAALMAVQEAVAKRRCMVLHYNKGGQGKLIERTIEALGLIFYSRNWHLVAWCRLRKAMRDFRVDRIVRWELTEETHSRHEDFSISDFIEDQIDVHAQFPVEIECEAWTLEYLLHDIPCQIDSQKKLSNGKYHLKGRAYTLDWLARWLIGFGSAAVALNPPELRSLLAAEAKKIAEIYKK